MRSGQAVGPPMWQVVASGEPPVFLSSQVANPRILFNRMKMQRKDLSLGLSAAAGMAVGAGLVALLKWMDNRKKAPVKVLITGAAGKRMD